ncbi:MAG: hypothetical protein QOF58_883 [Pseudonocardiales bacterium]|nr:hypothetical protein [Pseudonocardiales bacterium]
MCALLVVMSLAATALAAVVEQMRCTDAAREAARLAARGERQRGEEAAGQIAPGANIAFQADGDSITVVVTKRGPLGVPLSSTAFAALEPR